MAETPGAPMYLGMVAVEQSGVRSEGVARGLKEVMRELAGFSV